MNRTEVRKYSKRVLAKVAKSRIALVKVTSVRLAVVTDANSVK